VTETELKFQVPEASRKAVLRAVSTATARQVTLRARYFDTADRRLARSGIALRLRMEGPVWVQTLKGAGPSAMHRVEHEVRLEPVKGDPVLDPNRHAGTPAAQALAKALGDDAGPLSVVYETHVQRTLRSVRSAGSQVELAFDVGEVIAGDRRAPICELELELERGPVQGLLALAGQWVRRHHLWLDVRSKAERGDRLARGVSAGPVVQARRPRLDDRMGGDAALRAIVESCLAQILPNAADVAAGVGAAEHLHQLRVGLRRLRCALRVFGDGSVAADPAWSEALAALFSQLGAARDRDIVIETIVPALKRAGAPLTDLSPDAAIEDPGAALRDVNCNLLLLDLIAFAEGAPAPDMPVQPSFIASQIGPRIRRMRRRLKKDAEVFVTLDDAQRHRTRKRLKHLRYSIEFVASLYAASAVKAHLARIRQVQEVLGRYNDLSVAELMFRSRSEQDPRAWFAVGWLAARREQLVPEAAEALRALAQAPKLRLKHG